MNIEDIVIDCARQRLRESSMECVAEEMDILINYSFEENLFFDSLDYVEMALDLEHRLAENFIEIDSMKLQELKSIHNTVCFITNKLNTKS